MVPRHADSSVRSDRAGARAARRGHRARRRRWPSASSCATRGALFEGGDVLVAHAAFVAGRLGTPRRRLLFDVLELFAFVRPGHAFRAQRAGPGAGAGAWRCRTRRKNPRAALHGIAARAAGRSRGLARRCARQPGAAGGHAGARRLALGAAAERHRRRGRRTARPSPDWKPGAACRNGKTKRRWASPARSRSTPDEAARAAERAWWACMRPEQAAYSDAATYAFGPREQAGAPKRGAGGSGHRHRQDAGLSGAGQRCGRRRTGRACGSRTYTRNLQRQIVQEIAHLYPDPVERAEKAVVRKGRENYLCLLNFEEAAKRTALAPGQRSVALGADRALDRVATPMAICRAWAFPPSWRRPCRCATVTDRRGECIYAACPHYRICFIERAIRRARHARIVVANHALVIAQAAQDWLAIDETTDTPPERRAALCLRRRPSSVRRRRQRFRRRCCRAARWPSCAAGSAAPKARARTRMRGLEERLKDLIADDEAGAATRWTKRCRRPARWPAKAGRSACGGGRARAGRSLPVAGLSACARPQRRRRCVLYAGSRNPSAGRRDCCEAVRDLSRGLKRIADPLANLARLLRKKMDDKTAELEPYTKRAGWKRRRAGWTGAPSVILPAWIGMLDTLETGEISDDFVDWFEIAPRGRPRCRCRAGAALGRSHRCRWRAKCWSRRMAR